METNPNLISKFFNSRTLTRKTYIHETAYDDWSVWVYYCPACRHCGVASFRGQTFVCFRHQDNEANVENNYELSLHAAAENQRNK